MAALYSVFYEIEGVFDICRTDFSSMEAADFWVGQNLPANCNAKFYFILKDGHILMKGDIIDNTPEFFNDCMKFSKFVGANQAWALKQC